MIASLAQVLADATARMVRAAADRSAAMHMPVVGTPDGDLRMMTLRSCEGELELLRFHTDRRSPKVATIGGNALVSVLGFDPAAKVQLRLRGTARVETAGSLVDQAWADSSAYAQRCYLAQAAPGTVAPDATSGLPVEVEGIRPSAAQLEAARANFAVLLIQPIELDWLHLAHTGHRRARFQREGHDGWQGTWVVP